jgi:hypothetical protein
MSRARNKGKVAQVQYPLLVKESNTGNGKTIKLFGLIVDYTTDSSKEYDLGTGYHRTENVWDRKRVVFGFIKYLKSTNFNSYEWKKENDKVEMATKSS